MTLSIDPRFLGSHAVTWTALFALASVVLACGLFIARAPRLGVTRTIAYRIAVLASLWGLLGARLLHVLDYAGYYAAVPYQMVYFWNGGFSAWGAVLGATGGLLWHARRAGLPSLALGDLAVPGGLAGLALFRLGDFLTGQRIGTPTSLPWGVTYGHPLSPAYQPGVGQHPVALYEMLLVLALLGLVVLRGRLEARAPVVGALPEGALMLSALAAYGVVRFIVGFGSAAPTHLGLELAQWLGLAACILAPVFLARTMQRRRVAGQRANAQEVRTGRAESKASAR